ncbi:MAG: ABC transporter permease [Phenylobacterium sp.]|uniref:ABC transporter permease n=1 Tax=Phenylobacterium sp. TaxID=1871053 RepID=UPI0027361C84|nr:ABC transporter permease [Phenylobacterium sp.]MDP3746558.1 ABC transporter permease [Phenylobacterium sp.]
MTRYVITRIMLAIPTLLLALAAIFFLVRLIPGDPAQLMLGDVDDPAALARIRQELALDQPLPVQFGHWLLQLLRGDLGQSITLDSPVSELLLPSFAVTASLVVPAVVVAALIAIPAGVVAGWKQNTRLDVGVMTLATLALSIPSFWLGLMFLLVFGVYLNLLPVVGYVSPLEDFWQGLSYLVLPVMSLALIEAGVLIRLVRASAIEVLGLDYIAHARAKGLTEAAVIVRHVLPNAMAPTWTMIGLTLGGLLGGAVVTETVFSLPGLGRLMVESVFARDYPVIQGCMVIVTVAYVSVNLLTEITYPIFSPGARDA